jgi:site-specific DNA-cytosine methylase
MRQRAGRKVGRRLTLAEMREAMGVPPGFEMPALLGTAQYEVLGNGVPVPMARTIARAVRRAIGG